MDLNNCMILMIYDLDNCYDLVKISINKAILDSDIKHLDISSKCFVINVLNVYGTLSLAHISAFQNCSYSKLKLSHQCFASIFYPPPTIGSCFLRYKFANHKNVDEKDVSGHFYVTST